MVDSSFRPTVLVGVGGTGCRIAENVFKKANELETGLAGKIAVLGFDTDLNDMAKLDAIERANRFRFSSTDRLRNYIEKNRQIISDFMVDDDDLPQRFLNKSLIEGAGQIRMLSHLGLFTAQLSSDMKHKISNTFASLARMDNTENYQGFINVMIVGSIAGATGSGSFIQIATLIKEAATNIGVDVRGIFLMPDVYTKAANLPIDQIPNIKAGGYAALKELNAVNVLAEGKVKDLKFNYEFAPEKYISTSNFPFESVTLIDYESPDGRTLGKSLESYIGMCEKAVYQQIFSPIGGRMRSIEVNDTRSMLFAAAKGIDNVYSGIGISSINYPIEHNGDYLTDKFALEMLSGDWTRLDKQYAAKIKAHKRERASGNVISVEPVRRDLYLDDLDKLVRERSAFFVEIHDKLNPTIEDEKGNRRKTSQPSEFLSSLLKKVSGDFWSSKELSGAGTRNNIVPETLGNPASLVGDVRDLERGIDRDLSKLDELLRDKPRDILTDTLSFSDDLGTEQWSNYHIQSYIVKGGPHLVQVRAFLYSLQKMIEKRLATIDPLETRKKLFRLANSFEDEPDKDRSTRGAPGVLEKATQAVKSRGFARFTTKGKSESYAEEYVTYYNNSQKTLRKLADESIEFGMLSELLKEINLLETIVTNIFVEIESLIQKLDDKCSKSRRKYDNLATLDGNYWVFGSSSAKDALWEEMSKRVSGVGDVSGLNEHLSQAIYKKYRDDKVKEGGQNAVNIRELFQNTVIDGYARHRVTQENRSVYDMTIVEAIKNEAELSKTDWKDKLKEIVRIVGLQSTPLLGINDPSRDGQRIMFWSINPVLKDQINDAAMFQEMFTLNQGEAPVIMDEFSVYELTCVNTLVNLDLNQLSKLSTQDVSMGISGNKGTYYAEYEKMVDGLIKDGVSGNKSGHFTPHIHRDWHIPGVLPEIDPQVSDAFALKNSKGFTIARGLKLIEIEEEHGNYAIVYNSIGKRKINGVRKVLCSGSDWFRAIKEFEKNPALADDAISFWGETLTVKTDAKRKPVNRIEDTFAYKGIIEVDFVVTLLEMSATRDSAEARDQKTTYAISSWTTLVTEIIDAYRVDLNSVGKGKETDRLIEEIRHAAVEDIGAFVGKETKRAIEQACNRGMEYYYSRTERS